MSHRLLFGKVAAPSCDHRPSGAQSTPSGQEASAFFRRCTYPDLPVNQKGWKRCHAVPSVSLSSSTVSAGNRPPLINQSSKIA
jgi:hypothetical protein